MPDLQISLPLGSKTPRISEADLARVLAFLYGREWTTASAIEAALGLGDRQLRALAEQSGGRIISGPGCPGYKLFSSSTQLREVDEAASRLESQAHRMLARAISLRRHAHALIA